MQTKPKSERINKFMDCCRKVEILKEDLKSAQEELKTAIGEIVIDDSLVKILMSTGVRTIGNKHVTAKKARHGSDVEIIVTDFVEIPSSWGLDNEQE